MPDPLHPHPLPPGPRPIEQDKILIIDDDADEVEVLSLGLTRRGFAVLSATNGAQGRVTARRQHPDLIVLDVKLPDIDGFTLCQELADAPDTCRTPVIMLSCMTRPDIIRRTRVTGCQYCVRKPCDTEALLTLIRHSIDEARA
ncbi:MAG: response regulator [Planctomycetia bacterium]|nr:response regulator [Planctomycetia bacterium]